eukprot:TRINITY_DN41587_c0_g1_i1.p1 TRINITY_DN41587_c0_g1~~TRINITY_DN41587_c0_g1_i1.p1  ORF type:complete len:244 (+),score=50.91 TRINITY_DN41587_c0_g1_i1:156-887(+)
MYPGNARTPQPPTPLPSVLPPVPESLAATAPADIWRPSTGAGASKAPSLAASGTRGTQDRTSLPATSLGTRSKSATHLSSSLRSSAAAEKHREAQRMKIMKAVRKEEEHALSEFQAKSQVRSTLQQYYEFKNGCKERERQKIMDMPAHLKPGTNPVGMGCPPSYETQQAKCLNLPIKMAVEPKWSTELKKTNDRVGQRLEYERKLSAAIPGSMAPELPHMWPKKYISNPPTPFFVPGKGKEDY